MKTPEQILRDAIEEGFVDGSQGSEGRREAHQALTDLMTDLLSTRASREMNITLRVKLEDDVATLELVNAMLGTTLGIADGAIGEAEAFLLQERYDEDLPAIMVRSTLMLAKRATVLALDAMQRSHNEKETTHDGDA